MYGRRKKNNIKYWEFSDQLDEDISLRKKLAANNKLWMLSLVLIIGFIIIASLTSYNNNKVIKTQEETEETLGSFNDSEHREFAEAIEKIGQERDVDITVNYISNKAIKIVVPCDISNDEITFLSRLAARGTWTRFKTRPKVLVYTEDTTTLNFRLMATVEWSKEKNEFIVKFERKKES